MIARRAIRAVVVAGICGAIVLASAGPAAAHRLALGRSVGAKIMTAMEGVMPSRSLLARVRAGEVGGVLLFSQNVSSHLHKAISVLQHAALEGGGAPLVIAIDQEGGVVKRLPDAPPYLAPAAMSQAAAAREGRATGRALRRLGINTDLAPVADVSYPGDFLGTRAFSSHPARVAREVCAFARGLERAGVNATFKHFPGLGAARTDTDTTPTTVTLGRRGLVADLAPYRRCLPRLVMISNASYPALGSKGPAVFSSGVIRGVLRRKLAFHGVTISDTLLAPGIASRRTAVRAARAGVDMLLYVTEGSAAAAFGELMAAARRGLLGRRQLERSALRIRALAASPPSRAGLRDRHRTSRRHHRVRGKRKSRALRAARSGIRFSIMLGEPKVGWPLRHLQA